MTWNNLAVLDVRRHIRAFVGRIALQERRDAEHRERQHGAGEKKKGPRTPLKARRLAAMPLHIARTPPDPQRIRRDGCEERQNICEDDSAQRAPTSTS
jgi:hypothetical protein